MMAEARVAKKTVPSAVDRDADEETPTVGQDTDKLVARLEEQIAKQQEQVNKLMAERGIPADPVAAQIQALQDHLKAQAGANPLHAETYKPVVEYVGKLTSEGLTDRKAYKARNLVERLAEKHPAHELAYAKQLAQDLHTMTLDDEDEEEADE
jgi:hypothetical protein